MYALLACYALCDEFGLICPHMFQSSISQDRQEERRPVGSCRFLPSMFGQSEIGSRWYQRVSGSIRVFYQVLTSRRSLRTRGGISSVFFSHDRTLRSTVRLLVLGLPCKEESDLPCMDTSTRGDKRTCLQMLTCSRLNTLHDAVVLS